MRIVFTGPCELFTRNEFKELLEDNSIIMQNAITQKTDMLITDFPSNSSRTSKLRKARQLGIKIISYKEFLYEYIPEYII